MNAVLGLCLLAVSVQQVSSLQCYSCLTGCNDPFSDKGVSKDDCSGSCQKTEISGNVVRGCLPIVKQNDCKEAGGGSVCTCTEELCNGASGRYMSRVGVLVTIACICLSVLKFVF